MFILQKKRNQSGFTLIELLVVVAIIATLAAMIAPKLGKASDDAKKTGNIANIKQIESALERYKLDNHRYPSTDQGLEALVEKPVGTPEPKNWKGYLKRVSDDPWGNPYYYVFPGEHGEYDIYSLGADGLPGGTDSDKDVGNWNFDEN